MEPASVVADASAVEVIVERQLDAPFADAWAALTQPELVSRWLTSCARESARSYALTFREQDREYVKHLRVIRLRHRPGRACYSVLLQDPGYPDSVVTVVQSALAPVPARSC